jgi:hypothetical protein
MLIVIYRHPLGVDILISIVGIDYGVQQCICRKVTVIRQIQSRVVRTLPSEKREDQRFTPGQRSRGLMNVILKYLDSLMQPIPGNMSRELNF